jgi:hypothetical protein
MKYPRIIASIYEQNTVKMPPFCDIKNWGILTLRKEKCEKAAAKSGTKLSPIYIMYPKLVSTSACINQTSSD